MTSTTASEKRDSPDSEYPKLVVPKHKRPTQKQIDAFAKSRKPCALSKRLAEEGYGKLTDIDIAYVLSRAATERLEYIEVPK